MAASWRVQHIENLFQDGHPLRLTSLVGPVGIEPTPSTMSTWRSPAELRTINLAVKVGFEPTPSEERPD